MVAFEYRSIIGLVVEFIVAIDEARVRFTDDASYKDFFPTIFFLVQYLTRLSFCGCDLCTIVHA
jgi:hypothetical protein